MSTIAVKFDIDDKLLHDATKVYDNLGLDVTTAIKIFLRRSVLANGVPFSMTLPKRVYKAELASRALQELSDASAINGVRNMTLEEINAEISASRREREAAATL